MHLPGNLKDKKLVLASQSPRRSELLAMLDIPFSVDVPTGVEEKCPEGLTAEQMPEYLARVKAEAYRAELMKPDQVVVTADTLVIVDGEPIGKPADLDEARRMLRILSGRSHRVVTGVCVFTAEKMVSFSAATDVEFSSIPAEEIDLYVEKFRPLDKAGAYGIQEWIGAVGIRSISGSFYNVMGLPVHRLWDAFRSF